MPQIAQQDYLHFKQSMPIAANFDCELYAFLAGGIERGTIWDMVCDLPANEVVARVVGYSASDGTIYLGGNIPITDWISDYSSANYSGLAAIQRALLAQGVTVNKIPLLTYDEEGFLKNDETGDYLSVNGKKIKATLGSDAQTITAIAISDEDAPEGSLEITEQDAQKLVGIETV